MKKSAEMKAYRRANSQRVWLGTLLALLSSLLFGALTWWMAGSDAGWFIGTPALAASILSFAAYERGVRFRGTQAGHVISAVLALGFCLLGLYARYLQQVYLLNRELQPSFSEVVRLLPEAISNPAELPGVGVHHLSILIGSVIGFLLNSRIRRLS